MISSPIASTPIGYTPILITSNLERVSFDNYGLFNDQIRVIRINNDDLGYIDFSTFDYPLSNGG